MPESQKKPIPAQGFPERLGAWLVQWRWPVLIGTVLMAFGLATGGQYIGFNSDYHAFFSEENPQLQAFDALQQKYTQDDNVFIVIEPPQGALFTPKTLAAVEALVEEAWQTPYSSRVDALTNFQYTRAEGDDLYVEDLVLDARSKSDAELKEIRSIAIQEPLLLNRLIDSAGTLTAVNITVKLPGESLTEGNEVVAHVRQAIETFETQNPELKTYVSGMVMLNNAFQEAANTDMGTLMPLMFLVIVLTIYFTTRSVSGTLAALGVIILTLMTAVGFTGWAGLQLTPPSVAAFTIIITLAIADSIHILITLLQEMQQGKSVSQAITRSLKLNLMPVFITSITTVIGFLTMNFSDAPPFRDLGNITAVGMLAAFFFSITTLPALMAILPLRVKPRPIEKQQNGLLNRLAQFVVGNHRAVFWGSAVAVIAISLLSVRNDLNDEFVKYFDDGIAFRTDTDYISDNLTGIYNVEFSLGAGESGGINNPAYLEYLNEFEAWLYQQAEVVHVNSYLSVAKRVNKSMHGDSLAYYTIPSGREEAAQYLLLYELSLPFGLDLNNQINVDKSETRLTATVKNLSSKETIAFSEKAENWLAANTPEYMHTQGTSPTLMFSHLTQRQINSMITGTTLAIVLISLTLMLALRSVKHGVLSLIPNIAPITVGFGVWALSTGVINAGMAIVFGMTLGIIVDDTVHFISKYLRAVREQNKSAKEAVVYAFNTVGKALLVTTIVLVAGFLVLAQSQFGMNAGMAKITVLIISLALVIDFLLLPALLILTHGKAQPKTQLDSQIATIGTEA